MALNYTPANMSIAPKKKDVTFNPLLAPTSPALPPTMTSTPKIVLPPKTAGAGVAGGGGSSFGTNQTIPATPPKPSSVASIAPTPPPAPKPVLPPAPEQKVAEPKSFSEVASTPEVADTSGTQSNSWLDEFNKRMAEIDKTKAPTLPQGTDTVSQYGLTADQINAQLEQEKAAIRAKYDIMRREAEKTTENERNANLSGLYSVGEVNPLSSGTASIGAASQDVLNKRKDAINAMESEETANVVRAAYGFKETAQTAARQQQQDEITRIKEQRELEQNEWADNANKIKSALSLVQSGRQLTQDDKTNAWEGVSNLLTTYGTQVFDGVPETELAQYEKAAGIPKGTLSKGLKTMVELEAEGKLDGIEQVGDSLVAYKRNADGTYTSEVLFNAPKKTTGNGTGGLYDRLDYRTANAVLSKAQKFGDSPIVKKYNEFVSVGNLIAGVDPKTQNPAEHQAIVYNFAKALDPDSVVRESEYETVKKYAQSLIKRYGGEIKQAAAGTGFLSEQAIIDIQNAIENRLTAYEPQYQNLKSETSRVINGLAGEDVANEVLMDYESGYVGKTEEDLQTLYNQAGFDEPYEEMVGQYGEDYVRQVLQEQGFSSVGGDTNTAVDKIAMAIKDVESGGNYNAKGGSGETGAYQFMPSTWKQWAKQYLGNANAPMTQANQDKVAKAKIADLVAEGYTAKQIALIWNGGEPKVKKGTNQYGVKYDSGAYADKVLQSLNNLS